jgi:hypothetical protein
MGGGDEVDVVAASRLQVQHDVGQLPVGDFLALPAVADIEVMAEVS